MRSDGEPLPDLAETVVLRRLGLVRSDDLPHIAARWLALDVVDTESVRMLAGQDPHDPWALEQLLAGAVSEANVTVASEYAEVQRIALDWMITSWRDSGDTRWGCCDTGSSRRDGTGAWPRLVHWVGRRVERQVGSS